VVCWRISTLFLN